MLVGIDTEEEKVKGPEGGKDGAEDVSRSQIVSMARSEIQSSSSRPNRYSLASTVCLDMTTSAQSPETPPTPPDDFFSRTASPSTLTTTLQPPTSSNAPEYRSGVSNRVQAGSRNEVEAVGEQGLRNEVERNQSLSRVIQERWRDVSPEVRERYRKEQEEAERRAAREQGERG
ncbi:hypothetical protein JCM5350_007241 [Sporobolomyces pararoseus]